MLAAGCVTVCAATEAAAQTTTEQMKRMSLADLLQLDVTTVSRGPEPIGRVPAAIHVITQDDIRRSGAQSIPEVLRLAPGMQVARINAGTWSIGMRGFADRLARSMLVLIDGRAVYSPLFAGTYWETQDVLLEDVERIEVIRGPGGTLWGANAVNGIINIITKACGRRPRAHSPPAGAATRIAASSASDMAGRPETPGTIASTARRRTARRSSIRTTSTTTGSAWPRAASAPTGRPRAAAW